MPVLLLACMASIFFFSAQNAEESSKISSDVIVTVAKVVYPKFSEMSESEQTAFVKSFSNVVRKSAHFAIFAALGTFAILSLITYQSITLHSKAFLSALFSLAYAASDEFHQTTVPGRSGELHDIFLDFSGALLGILIVTLITAMVLTKRSKNEPKMFGKKLISYEFEELKQQCGEYEKTVTELEAQNAKLLSELTALKNQSISESPAPAEPVVAESNKSPALAKSSPLKNLQKKVAESVSPAESNSPAESIAVSDSEQLGSEIIGKIVIKAAECCNSLTADGSDSKELVNLILGRCEVAKAEILEIVSGDSSFSAKKKIVETKQKEVEDYFLSVMGQKE